MIDSKLVNKTKKFVLGELKELDEYNYEHYKKVFDSLSDAEFVSLLKKRHLRFYESYADSKVTYNSMLKFTKKRKIVNEAYLHLPNVYKDEDGNAPVTRNKVMVWQIPIRRTQQQIFSKNSAGVDIGNRDVLDQAQGDDKGGKINKAELNALVSAGYDKTIIEQLTVRSSNPIAKKNALKSIEEKGSFNLEETDYKNPKGKTGTKVLAGYYAAMQLVTDLGNRDPDEYV